MLRATRSSARQAAMAAKAPVKTESPVIIKTEPGIPESKTTAKRRRTTQSTASPEKSKRIKIKKEEDSDPEDEPALPLPATPNGKPIKKSQDTPSKATLEAKKLKAYSQYASKSPFPDFVHPTADETRLARRILSSIHGERVRPQDIKAPTSRAGCGDAPSVLDALVRTILSQNTSDANSTRAKKGMDAAYGRSDAWDLIAKGGPARLEDAIKSGGLAGVKSRAILKILDQVHEKYGDYSLDHLFEATDEEAMRELISFKGVGPKTASCVLLFCLKRESFAVDTHVWRITGMLGWRPASATRDETYAHLDVKIPAGDKYPLHVLMVRHGKDCDECKAGGKNLGKCELRKAFKKRAKNGEVEGPQPDMSGEEEDEVDEKE